jgi:SAM-dependent methyltransferase
MKNANFLDPKSHYYTRVKVQMFPLIQTGPNVVMDVGCGAGHMGAALLSCGKATRLIGIELFRPAAVEAKKTYEDVHIGDIEELKVEWQNYFDYVICGDILEHLRDPKAVVARLFDWLKPGGHILVCVPNIRNYNILLDLFLYGSWEYQPAGILDQTHLRFFTKSSCRKLLTEVGFGVDFEGGIVGGRKVRLFDTVTLGVFKDFLATQLICRGTKPPTKGGIEPAT